MKSALKKIISITICICIIAGGITVYTQNTEASDTTTIYFLNTKNWDTLYGYVYSNGSTVGNNWPGKLLTKASDLGDDWWKIDVEMDADSSSFNIIVSDNGSQSDRVDARITSRSAVFIYPGSGTAYESAMATEVVSGYSVREYKDYDVNTEDLGNQSTVTTYQAEDAYTNATILKDARTYMNEIQSEASGRSAVRLDETGEYVEFMLTEPANALVVRYSMPDSSDGSGLSASLSMYINGEQEDSLALTSKYAWVYGSYPYYNTPSAGAGHRFFDDSRLLLDKTYEAGTTIRLQKNSSDNAEYYVIDFIECEQVQAANTRPDNSLSIVDYGATAGDSTDDYNAIKACITAAKQQGKKVWIPEGDFRVDTTDYVINGNNHCILADNVVIVGAGMWRSNLIGAGAAFAITGTSEFYDFSIIGASTVRLDSDEPAAFQMVGSSSNIVIENIWIEHVKVGLWASTVTGLTVQGCRIRDTYADGINLSTSTNSAVIQNNSIRNTGDDGIAIWPWTGNCTGNTISHNRVQLPMLANCIAVYGGSDNTVSYNIVEDSVNNGSGICIGSQYTTSNGFGGTTTVNNNLLMRCGTRQTDYGYNIGAIWIWATQAAINANYVLNSNIILNSTYEGILFDCYNTVAGFKLSDTKIYNCTEGVWLRGTYNTQVEFKNIAVADNTENLYSNDNSSASLTMSEKGIYSETAKLREKQKNSRAVAYIEGYQINKNTDAFRTVYCLDAGNETAVRKIGLIYGLSDKCTRDDMTLDSTNKYVHVYEASAAGKYSMLTSTALVDAETSTYVMTMKFGDLSKNFLKAGICTRAYAVLDDGSVIYSDVSETSVYAIAQNLYDGELVNQDVRQSLYDKILSVLG